MSEKKILIILMAFAVILRVFAAFYTGNIHKQNYWEYGSLAQNMLNGNGYSLFYFNGKYFDYRNDLNFNKNKPLPSAYMPIGYPILIIPAFAFSTPLLTNTYIILVNILFDMMSILILFRLTILFFNKKAGLIAVFIFAFLPEFIFSSTLTGVTSIYHFFVLLIFYQFKIYCDNRQLKNIIYLSLILGMFLYFRSEPIIFLLIISIYLLKNKNLKHSIILISIPIIILLPIQIRNYLVFERIIPLTTSGGVNLYRGNNPYNIGNWGDDDIFKYRETLSVNKEFELKLNGYYLSKSTDYINSNKFNVLSNSFNKLFHLWIINPNDSRVYNLIYLIPWFVLLSLFIVSFRFIELKNINIILLFLIYSTITATIFFALPRYQTFMKISLIPQISYLISIWIDSLKKLKLKKLNDW